MMITTRTFLLIALGILAILTLLFSLLHGTVWIRFDQFLSILLLHPDDPFLHQVIFELRLPRTLSAFMTGGLLALAGALMQVLLRNPLADPYILGISSGAATGALFCMVVGLGGVWITGGAWLGSLTAILLVLFLSRHKSSRSAARLLLTGIALASGLSALISFILVISPDPLLRGMVFWLLGDLDGARMPLVEACVLGGGLLISLCFANALNIFTHGEKQAQTLGMNVPRFQVSIYLLSSLFTATAVSLAGCIGFVGFIVPHLVRLMAGYDHRYLLPGSVLLGGSLLTLADTIARTLMAPQQLPIGMIMSLLGVPIFLVLLRYTHDSY